MASSQGKSGGSSRAMWTPDLHKVWVDLCLNQVLTGHRTNTTIDRQGWSTVIQEFTRITGKNYSQKQMKNHWDVVKSKWKIFHKLSTYAGSGWDPNPINETFTVGDDFWEDYLKTYPDAAQFRHKGLPHAANLDIIFGGMIARGDNWSSNEGVLPKVVPLTQTSLNDDQMDNELLNESQSESELVSDMETGPEMDTDEEMNCILYVAYAVGEYYYNTFHKKPKRNMSNRDAFCKNDNKHI